MLNLDENNNFIILEFSYLISKENFDQLKIDYNESDNKKTFLEKNYDNYFVNNLKSILYDIDNEREGSLFKDITSNIDKLISFKYIEAKRKTSNDEIDRLSFLASKYYKNVDNRDKEILDNFDKIIDETDEKISDIYGEIFKEIIGKIKKFGGINKEESLMKIISSINKKRLLEGNSKVVYEENNYMLPENYNGLGYLNLFHIIFDIELKLMDFRKDNEINNSPADINLLFIEEPEVHTHPQMQYIFIENIKSILEEGCDVNNRNLNLQTIITSHSSHIISKCDFNDVKYFYKDAKRNNITSKNLTDLEKEYGKQKEHFKFLKQYLTLNSSELFFAEKAIFIEGDTERILLPKIMEMIDNDENIIKNGDIKPLLSQNISILEIGNYSHIFEKFIDFIGLKTLIITDIDSGKKNKDNKIIKSQVSESTEITNPSIKFFFSNKSWYDLKNFKVNKKVFVKTENNWENDKNGILMLAYQTFQESVNYHPRTFEDAFVSLNKNFIYNNEETFNSLKNFSELESNNDFYELTEKIIGKKSAFAIEILIASQNDENSDWIIPDYIKEGLLWLRDL